jgi:hypothetical protein
LPPLTRDPTVPREAIALRTSFPTHIRPLATALAIASAVASGIVVTGCDRGQPADAGSIVTARTLGLAYLQTDVLS